MGLFIITVQCAWSSLKLANILWYRVRVRACVCVWLNSVCMCTSQQQLLYSRVLGGGGGAGDNQLASWPPGGGTDRAWVLMSTTSACSRQGSSKCRPGTLRSGRLWSIFYRLKNALHSMHFPTVWARPGGQGVLVGPAQRGIVFFLAGMGAAFETKLQNRKGPALALSRKIDEERFPSSSLQSR